MAMRVITSSRYRGFVPIVLTHLNFSISIFQNKSHWSCNFFFRFLEICIDICKQLILDDLFAKNAHLQKCSLNFKNNFNLLLFRLEASFFGLCLWCTRGYLKKIWNGPIQMHGENIISTRVSTREKLNKHGFVWFYGKFVNNELNNFTFQPKFK